MRPRYIKIEYKNNQLKPGSILLIVNLICFGLLIIIPSIFYIILETTLPTILSINKNIYEDQFIVTEHFTNIRFKKKK